MLLKDLEAIGTVVDVWTIELMEVDEDVDEVELLDADDDDEDVYDDDAVHVEVVFVVDKSKMDRVREINSL